MKYYINGWRESKSYFMSFGFTEAEIKSMESGRPLMREYNIFEIRDTD